MTAGENSHSPSAPCFPLPTAPQYCLCLCTPPCPPPPPPRTEPNPRFLEAKTPLEDLLEVKPDYAGGPPKERPGILMAHQRQGAAGRAGAMSPSMVAGSTSSGSAWASDMTDHQTLVGSSMLGGLAGHMGQQQAHSAVRRPREGTDGGSPTGGMQTPKVRW